MSQFKLVVYSSICIVTHLGAAERYLTCEITKTM